MRKLLVSCLLLIAGFTARVQAAPAAPEDEQAILKIERDACNAYLHADADYLDALLTDDFSFTNSRAEMNTKAEELAEVRKKEVRYTVFENSGMKVHQHGDTAVVTGRTRVEGTPADGKAFAVDVEFTDVFTRMDGKWRMVAGHVSRVPPKAG